MRVRESQSPRFYENTDYQGESTNWWKKFFIITAISVVSLYLIAFSFKILFLSSSNQTIKQEKTDTSYTYQVPSASILFDANVNAMYAWYCDWNPATIRWRTCIEFQEENVGKWEDVVKSSEKINAYPMATVAVKIAYTMWYCLWLDESHELYFDWSLFYTFDDFYDECRELLNKGYYKEHLKNIDKGTDKILVKFKI
jgi:hypothetical protein